MAGNNLFRTAMFGGYNKEDVNEYIQSLEYELEASKKNRMEEKRKWKEQSEREQEQKDAELPILKEENQRLTEEVEDLQKRLQELEEELDRLRLEKGAVKEKQGDSLEESADALETIRQLTEKIKEQNAEEKMLREMVQRLEAENEELKEEGTRSMQEKTDSLGQEDGLFTYGTVKKIMEDAHKNAELIHKEAKHKADLIVKEAEEEAERQKALIVERINAQLDEKGIQLIAAKYKIEQYLKEVNDASRALQNVYSHMSNVVQNMPTRIDNYWEGDYQKMMMKNRKGIGMKETSGDPSAIKDNPSANKTE